MTESTKRIIEIIAAENSISPEEVAHEMMEAIRAGMASPDPRAQALWKQICPDGKELDLDTFLTFMANRVDMMMDKQHSKKKGKNTICS